MRISEISRIAWRLEHPPSQVESLQQHHFALTDLDEAQLEVVIPYIPAMQAIGIDLDSAHLHDDFNANPWNTETAILLTLSYAQRLHEQGRTFGGRWHATNYLAKALREGWKSPEGYSLQAFESYYQAHESTWVLWLEQES